MIELTNSDSHHARRRGTAFGMIACLTVVLLWFSPWWLGGRNLAPLDLLNKMMSPWREGNETHFAKNHIVSDGVDQYLVYRMIAADSFRKEGWVGWSSLTYGGTAQHANTMALYYDWTMQLHRWFDFWSAWHLGLLGQVLLAAWGMFLFLHRRGTGALWAVCGALIYAANSQFVTWIYHRWALGAFCWVPWILWAIDGYRGGKWRAWSLVPIFITMAFIGGTLQHAALVVLAVAAMWIEEALSLGGRPAAQMRLFGRYAAWGALGTGLAAMMFLPCTDAFLSSNQLGLHTGMTANAANSIYPQGVLQPLFNLASYPFQCFPSVLGRCDSLDLLKLFKSELFYVAYFGSLPVLIAFWAPWRRDSPMLARLLIASGLVLPLTPLVRLLYQRLYLLFILGGVLAFAHFMATATRETRLRAFRIFVIAAGGGIAIWTVASLWLLSQPDRLSTLKEKIVSQGKGSSFGYFDYWIIERADRFIGDLFIWSPQQLAPLLLLLLALAGLRLSASRSMVRRLNGKRMLALAVVCEVTLFGARWVAWSDPAQYPLFPETAESVTLKQLVGPQGRVSTVIHPLSHMALTPFVPNTLAAYGISSISGYDSIVPRGMILPNESPDNAGKLGPLGVSHLITWPGNPDIPHEWKPVWSSPSMDLYENTLKCPRYMGFKEVNVKEDFFAGRRSEYLALTEKSGKENSRLLDIPPGVRWIRIAENHADGWEYRVASNAQWIPVSRAPDTSMLLENAESATNTRIEMRYDPPTRKAGMAISLAALAALVFGQMVMLRICKPEVQ